MEAYLRRILWGVVTYGAREKELWEAAWGVKCSTGFGGNRRECDATASTAAPFYRLDAGEWAMRMTGATSRNHADQLFLEKPWLCPKET